MGTIMWGRLGAPEGHARLCQQTIAPCACRALVRTRVCHARVSVQSSEYFCVCACLCACVCARALLVVRLPSYRSVCQSICQRHTLFSAASPSGSKPKKRSGKARPPARPKATDEATKGLVAETTLHNGSVRSTRIIDDIWNAIESCVANVDHNSRKQECIDVAAMMGLIFVLQQGLNSAWRPDVSPGASDFVPANMKTDGKYITRYSEVRRHFIQYLVESHAGATMPEEIENSTEALPNSDLDNSTAQLPEIKEAMGKVSSLVEVQSNICDEAISFMSANESLDQLDDILDLHVAVNSMKTKLAASLRRADFFDKLQPAGSGAYNTTTTTATDILAFCLERIRLLIDSDLKPTLVSIASAVHEMCTIISKAGGTQETDTATLLQDCLAVLSTPLGLAWPTLSSLESFLKLRGCYTVILLRYLGAQLERVMPTLSSQHRGLLQSTKLLDYINSSVKFVVSCLPRIAAHSAASPSAASSMPVWLEVLKLVEANKASGNAVGPPEAKSQAEWGRITRGIKYQLSCKKDKELKDLCKAANINVAAAHMDDGNVATPNRDDYLHALVELQLAERKKEERDAMAAWGSQLNHIFGGSLRGRVARTRLGLRLPRRPPAPSTRTSTWSATRAPTGRSTSPSSMGPTSPTSPARCG